MILLGQDFLPFAAGLWICEGEATVRQTILIL